MPELIQPGTGEHPADRSSASLSDQTNNQPDEGPEGGSGKAWPKHDQQIG
jgi:hypothetical protein